MPLEASSTSPPDPDRVPQVSLSSPELSLPLGRPDLRALPEPGNRLEVITGLQRILRELDTAQKQREQGIADLETIMADPKNSFLSEIKVGEGKDRMSFIDAVREGVARMTAKPLGIEPASVITSADQVPEGIRSGIEEKARRDHKQRLITDKNLRLSEKLLIPEDAEELVEQLKLIGQSMPGTMELKTDREVEKKVRLRQQQTIKELEEKLKEQTARTEAAEEKNRSSKAGDVKVIEALDALSVAASEITGASPVLTGALVTYLKESLTGDELKKLIERLRTEVGKEGLEVGVALTTGMYAGYRIEKVLGGGLDGAVYLAVDKEGRRWALKERKVKTLDILGSRVESKVLMDELTAMGYIRNCLQNLSRERLIPQNMEYLIPFATLDRDSYQSQVLASWFVEGQDMEQMTTLDCLEAARILTQLSLVSYILARAQKIDPGSLPKENSAGFLPGGSRTLFLESDLANKADRLFVGPDENGELELKGIIDFSIPGEDVTGNRSKVAGDILASTKYIGRYFGFLVENKIKTDPSYKVIPEVIKFLAKIAGGKYPDLASVYMGIRSDQSLRKLVGEEYFKLE